jgi:hypothetical protein
VVIPSAGKMDYTHQITRIIRENDNPIISATQCNLLFKKEHRDLCVRFAEWLRYQDDVFDKYISNKIATDKLYLMFLDELKL